MPCVTAGPLGPELFSFMRHHAGEIEMERESESERESGWKRLMQNFAVGFPYDLTCNRMFLVFYYVYLE